MKNIILITGASSGLGLEFALQLDTAFSNIDEFWLIARREERLQEIAAVLEHETRIIPMDITDEYAMDDLEQLLDTEKATVRILVNCAGYGLIGNFDDLEIEEQLGMLMTNCEGLTKLTYLCLPYMQRNSRIIQLSSSAAFLPQPGFSIYAATKSYVLSFSRALREELLSRQVYVTAVCPGPVDTEFFNVAEQYGEILDVKRFVMADAEAVVSKAIRDSYEKKAISVYGLPIKALHAAAKILPTSLLLGINRFLK